VSELTNAVPVRGIFSLAACCGDGRVSQAVMRHEGTRLRVRGANCNDFRTGAQRHDSHGAVSLRALQAVSMCEVDLPALFVLHTVGNYKCGRVRTLLQYRLSPYLKLQHFSIHGSATNVLPYLHSNT
jgi:hypothetical protein